MPLSSSLGIRVGTVQIEKTVGGGVMRRVLLLTSAFLLASSGAFAQSDAEILRELQQLKARISQLEKELKEKNSKEEEVEKEVEEIKERLSTLEIHGGVRLYYQGASVGKIDGQDFSNPNGVGYNADVELTFKPDPAGEFYMRLHSGAGTGADKIFEKADEPLYANLNTLADDNPDTEGTFKILEAYYTRSFFNDRLNLVVGKTEPFIMIDDNGYANDETTQFVGKPFVNNPILDPEDFFAPMVGVTLSLTDSWEVNAVLQSNDYAGVEWNGQEWVQKEKNIYDNIFDKPFLAFQVKYSPEINGLSGNYRFYVWDNRADHIKVGEPVNNPSVKPSTDDGWGVGVSFDQQITENAGVFFRAAYGNKNVYSVTKFVSGGISLEGLIPSRPKDILGVGVASLFPNRKLEHHSPEVHFEGYYRIAVSDNLFITPDLQYVLNPHGNSSNDSIVAGMVRAEFSF